MVYTDFPIRITGGTMKINKKTIIAIVIPVVLIGLAVMVYFIVMNNAPEPSLESIEEEQVITAPEVTNVSDSKENPESTELSDKKNEHLKAEKYLKHENHQKHESHLKQEKEDEMFWKDKKKEKNQSCERPDSAGRIEPRKNYVEYQVLSAAESEAEAKRIAERIGGTLSAFSHGIAVIEIPITVAELMKKIEDENITDITVQPNFIYTTFGGGLERDLVIEQ